MELTAAVEQQLTSDQMELVDALSVMAFQVMAVLSKFAAENDLSLTQVRMLGILRDRRLAISELAAVLGLDRSSVSGLVDRTEKRGLLQRLPHPSDGRSVQVTVSPRGARAAAHGADEIAQSMSALTRHLNRVEAQRLTRLLERLRDAMAGSLARGSRQPTGGQLTPLTR
jgi:DNA-binding MarR family transcriptional regulator